MSNNRLLALLGAVGFMQRSMTKENQEEINELEKLLQSEYGIEAADLPKIPDKESLLPAPPPPTPPAMVCCNPKDGKARRRERRAMERKMKKQNKRY